MEQNQPNIPDAPPTDPVGLGPIQKQPVWPSLLGVISIVLGAMGALNGLMSSVAPLFMGWLENLMAGMGPNAPTATFDAYKGWEIPSVVSGVCSLGVAVLLIVAGSGLAGRRRWGVKVQKVWAVLKLILTPVVVVIGVQMQIDQTDAMMTQAAANPGGGAPPAAFLGPMKAMAYGMGALMILWGWALPITSLIWLNTARARKDISGW